MIYFGIIHTVEIRTGDVLWKKAFVNKDRIVKDAFGIPYAEKTEIFKVQLDKEESYLNWVIISYSLHAFQPTILYIFSLTTFNYFFQINVCISECNRKEFCSSWCIVDYECLITNILISPQNGPEKSQICYTNRERGNQILNSVATDSASHLGTRNAVALTKGIYNGNYMETSAGVEDGTKPFMLFEFNSEILVRLIRFKVMSSSYFFLANEQTEVRLGKIMTGPNNFSQLTLIGTFQNVQKAEWKTFLVQPPINAKFLGIVDRNSKKFSFSYIEVFS